MLTLVLVFAVAFLMVVCHNLKSEIVMKNSCIEQISIKNDAANMQFLANINNAGVSINQDILVKTIAGEPKSILDLVVSSSVLVCRISEKYCDECVDHAIKVIRDTKGSIDMSKVLFVVDSKNNSTFKKFVMDYDLEGFNVLNCPNLGIPADEAMFPYIMAVDSSLRVLSVYFPTKSTHGTDYDYRHVKYMYDKLIR